MENYKKYSLLLVGVVGLLLTLTQSANGQCFGKQESKTDSSIYDDNTRLTTQEPSVFSESVKTESFQQVLYDRQLEFTLNLFHKLYKKVN